MTPKLVVEGGKLKLLRTDDEPEADFMDEEEAIDHDEQESTVEYLDAPLRLGDEPEEELVEEEDWDDAGPNMWDSVVDDGLAAIDDAGFDEIEPALEDGDDEPMAASPTRRASRVKTRILGFGGGEPAPEAPAPEERAEAAPAAGSAASAVMFAVGWVLIRKGPGRGHSIPLAPGLCPIGRGEDQAVRLDFGDNSISRANHALIAYDEEQCEFFLGHGGKANIVRLNGSPVLSTVPVKNGDLIRVGETTLQLVALCGEDFSWADDI
ncbi:MAG: FHA domain-containing protein [Rhodobacteraceae bacterium]|nr:FHA domain-containing protein [Paracoccaceae bacterium]